MTPSMNKSYGYISFLEFSILVNSLCKAVEYVEGNIDGNNSQNDTQNELK